MATNPSTPLMPYSDMSTDHTYTGTIDENSLWCNSMVNSIMANMSDSDKETYRKMGEYMYNSIDFDDCSVIKSMGMPSDLANAYAQIVNALRSGLLIDDLNAHEVELMKHLYQDKWRDHLTRLMACLSDETGPVPQTDALFSA